MRNNQQSIKEIREAMDKWASALKEKDLDAMHKDYADECRMFDIGSTANNMEDIKKLWEHCFFYFDKPTIEYKDMVIEANNDMAVAHFNSRMDGINVDVPEEMANIWIRGTICFRKIDGIWKSIHEHHSFPVNCQTNQINFETAK